MRRVFVIMRVCYFITISVLAGAGGHVNDSDGGELAVSIDGKIVRYFDGEVVSVEEYRAQCAQLKEEVEESDRTFFAKLGEEVAAYQEQQEVYDIFCAALECCDGKQSCANLAAIYEEYPWFDINTPDPHPRADGATLLHVMVGLGGCDHCFMQLWPLGAAPFKPDKNGQCAYDLAHTSGYDKLAGEMLYQTLQELCNCIVTGNSDMLNRLLSENSVLNINYMFNTDSFGCITLLHYELFCCPDVCNTDCAQVLMDHGASPDALDQDGVAVWAHALRCRDKQRLAIYSNLSQ